MTRIWECCKNNASNYRPLTEDLDRLIRNTVQRPLRRTDENNDWKVLGTYRDNKMITTFHLNHFNPKSVFTFGNKQVAHDVMNIIVNFLELQDLAALHRVNFKIWPPCSLRVHYLCLPSSYSCQPTPLSLMSKLTVQGLRLKDLNQIVHINSLDVRILSALESLNLAWFSDLTDADMFCLLYRTSLKNLNLKGCRQITDSGLYALKNLLALQKLDLEESNITHNGLIHLKELTKMQELNLSKCFFIKNLNALSGFGSLTNLNLTSCRIEGAGWSALSNITSLQILNLGGCIHITDSDLLYLSNLTALQALDLSGLGNITDSGLSYLIRLSVLQDLSLPGCKITDDGLRYLRVFTSMQKLNLSCCEQITELTSLENLTALHTLMLGGCEKLTDSCMVTLGVMTALRSLRMPGSKIKITDHGLLYLSALTALEDLSLAFFSYITDRGLTALSGLTGLQKLSLHECRGITDHGLSALSGLTNLQILDAWGLISKITQPALAAFTESISATQRASGKSVIKLVNDFFGYRDDEYP